MAKKSVEEPLKAMDDSTLIKNGIYCPVKKVILYAGSRLLDQLNGFTKFILLSLSKGYTMRQLCQAVSLGEYIVKEELEYLKSIKFISQVGTRFIVESAGSRYVELQQQLEAFNQQQIKAQINLYDGNIYLDNDLAVKKECFGKQVKTFPNIVDRFIIQNDDYANVKDFVADNYQIYFGDHNFHEEEDIYFQCRDVADEELMYVPYRLTDAYDTCESPKEDTYYKIYVERLIAKISFTNYCLELDPYREVITELTKLDYEHHELLSEEGHRVIDLIYKEVNLGSKVRTLWLDLGLGYKRANIKNDLLDKKVLTSPPKHWTIIDLDPPSGWQTEVLAYLPQEADLGNRIKDIILEHKYQAVSFEAFVEVRNNGNAGI